MRVVIATDGRQPNARYRDALLSAGAFPGEVVAVMPGQTPPEAWDGLLLAGGCDVDPFRYGEAPAAPCLELDPARDELDFGLLALARHRAVPVFGICRGIQVLNVALGGSLWQDLPTQRARGLPHGNFVEDGFPPDHPGHAVRPCSPDGRPGSLGALLAASGEAVVNSRHHQAVRDLAPSLVPVVVSPDGLVEAVERPSGPFLAGVQWHPEDLVRQPAQKEIFRLFLEACRAHARERR